MALTQTQWLNVSETMKTITASWTANANGSFTAADITGCKGMYLVQVTTNPGDTAPQANYDITLKDTDGVDIMGGTLANRHTENSETVLLTQMARPVESDLTVAITGNNVNAAVGTIKLYLSSTPSGIVAAA